MAFTSPTESNLISSTRKCHCSNNANCTSTAESKPRRVRFASSELISSVNHKHPIHFISTGQRSMAQDDIAIHPLSKSADDFSSFHDTNGCCFLNAIAATTSSSTTTNSRSRRSFSRNQQRSTSFSSISSTFFPSLSSSSTTPASSPLSSSNSSATNIGSCRTHGKEQQSHLTKINKFIMASITTPLSTLLANGKDSKTHEKSLDVLLEHHSAELQRFYENAKVELDCAIETQGSVYYQDDRVTAENALKLCSDKYLHVIALFGDTTHAIKFKFRWEQDLHTLQSIFQKLPLRTSPVILEEEHEPSTAYHYFHKYN